MCESTTALEILYHHAARNITPHTTLDIARLALLHRESLSEPIVTLAKNISHVLESEVISTVRFAHPRVPPTIDIARLIALVPTARGWGVTVHQEILDLALHDAIIYNHPLDDIRALVDGGANVDSIPETAYFSPLTSAMRRGRDDITNYLVFVGAKNFLCGS